VRTLRDYCEKYEREYLIFLKRADINVIKEVNQKLPEFTSSDPFTVPFYRKILSYLITFIKDCSGNIPPFNAEDYNKEVAGRVEALSSLCRYYRLVEISMKMFQNYSYFMSHSCIVVLKDYKESKAGLKELELVREEVRKLE